MPVYRSRFRRTLSMGLATAWILTALLAGTPAAHANIYKCSGDGGTVVYQEAPCPPGKELRNFDLDPPTLSVIPGGNAPPPARGAAAADKAAKDSRSIHGDRTIGKVVGDAKARRFIHRGMTEAEVLSHIGRPDVTAGGSRKRQARWSYLPAADDPDTVTTITFSGGTVSEVTRRVVKQ